MTLFAMYDLHLPMRINLIGAGVKYTSTCLLSHLTAITHSIHCDPPPQPLLLPHLSLSFFSRDMHSFPLWFSSDVPLPPTAAHTLFELFMCLYAYSVQSAIGLRVIDKCTDAPMHRFRVQIFPMMRTGAKQWYLCCTSVWPLKDLLPA